MSNADQRPGMAQEADEIADLAERLLAALSDETALIGPGLGQDIGALARLKEVLAQELAARLPLLAQMALSSEALDYFHALDARFQDAARANAGALQAVLDSQSRVMRQLAENAARRASPAAYGPTGALNTPAGVSGAVPGGTKKI